ncbi:MAG: tetratricopeptide repeat protein [Candidatus Moranbacteria bacterium]|nr:tetratricopeptide repeat protein [Candidatus Moranbacteria bacterium]
MKDTKKFVHLIGAALRHNRILTVFCFLLIAAIMLWSFRLPASYFLWERLRLEKTALAINPSDSGLQFVIGNYYFGQGAYDITKAKKYFQTTIALNEQYPRAHYQLSRTYFIQGNLNRAIKEINRELELYPDFKRSYYIRGLTYGYKGDFAKAAADFEEFLKWKPESWAGHNDLAWIYFQMGEYEKVLATVEEGLKYAKNNVWLLNSEGVALLNLGRKDEARETFEKVLPMAMAMSPAEWGQSYPGNNPEIYPKGLTSMQESIKRNLRLLDPDYK